MGSEWSAEHTQQYGELPGYMYNSLKMAQQQNPDLRLLPNNKAHYRAASSDRPVKVVKSLVGLCLVWGLTGCTPGKQHVRECVPHSIRGPACLKCPWCNYNEDEWVAYGKQKIPESELRLMGQLVRTGWDMDARWQAKLQFWAAPVDFVLRTHRSVVLQADGSCHFDGLYQENATTKLASDLRFCVAAMTTGLSVVRVHVTEVNNKSYPTYLHAGIQAAIDDCCIVLSPSYSTIYMYDQGLPVTYAHVLAGMLPESKLSYDKWHNTVIFPK